MIDVKLIRKLKATQRVTGNGIATNGNSYTPGGVVKEAAHAANADNAIYAKEAGHAANADNATYSEEAGHATSSYDLDSDSPVRKQFLSRISDDELLGIIEVLKHFKSTGYTHGSLGTGWWLGKDLQDEDRSLLVVDKLMVRYKAIFEALEIKHVKHVGGELTLSPAGADIISVDDQQVTVPGVVTGGGSGEVGSELPANAPSISVPMAWRCRLRTSDGTDTVVNEFAVGDMARCKTFNLAEGRDLYYWRKVVNVGPDYVDLSVDDCDPSVDNDAPQAGDSIVTFGNDRDPSRQNAITITSYDTDAPAIRLHQGIKTYSTAGTQKIVISPQGSKFTGDLVVTVEGREVPLAQFLADAISLNVLAPQPALLIDDATYQQPPDDDGSSGDYSVNVPAEALMDLPEGARIAIEIDFDGMQNPHGGVFLSVSYDQEIYFLDEAIPNNGESDTLRREFTLSPSLPEYLLEHGFDATSICIDMSSDYAQPFAVNGWRIYSVPLTDALKETGVDIRSGKITLKGDTEIITNDGKSAALFRDGKIKGDYIEATEVTAVRVATTPDKPGGARSRIEGGRQEYYDDNGDLRLLVHSGSVSPQNAINESLTVNTPAPVNVPHDKTTADITVTEDRELGELYRTDLSGLHPGVAVSVSRSFGADWPSGLPLAEVHFQAVLEASLPVDEDGDKPGSILWEADVVRKDYTGPETLVLTAPALPESVWLHRPEETFDGSPAEGPYRIKITATVRIRADYPAGWTLSCSSDSPTLPLSPTRRFSEIAADGAALRAGEYAFRITAAGIEASRDAGNTWETIFQ